MPKLKIKGKHYTVHRSNRKNKKFKIYKNGKTIHFGEKGYSISPGTKKGDRYCARSYGIKTNDPFSPNSLSRMMWKCVGKKSRR